MSSPTDPAHDREDAAPRRSRDPLRRAFFGRDADVDPNHLRILRLVGLGVLFENYDIGLVNSALPQIAPDLGMQMTDTGFLLGIVRLGGLGALLLVPLSDRIGRRRVFLGSLIGMSLGTLATGFSQDPLQFVVLQFVTRAFMLTAAALAVVILVEEFPPGQRGSAVGMVSVIGGIGYGLGAGLYAAVDALPYGWRALYAAGIVPLAALPFFRRALRETRRYEAHAARRSDAGAQSWRDWLRPFLELIRTHPWRALIVSLAGLLGSMGSIAVFQYTSMFVQTEHGWAPGQYSALVLGGGLIGMLGTLVGGRGSDRFGRRTVGFIGLAMAPLFAVAFFEGPTSTLVMCWGTYVLCMAAGDVVVRAFAAELFPTSHRGTSSGLLVAVQSIGFSLGLFAVGMGVETAGELGRAVSLVSLVSVAAGACLFFLPETSRSELEGISDEGDADEPGA